MRLIFLILTFTFSCLSYSKVTLKWKPSPLSEKYLIEISEDNDFDESIVKKETIKNTFQFTPKKVGKFYWRVWVFDKYLKEWTRPSKIGRILVRYRKIKTDRPSIFYIEKNEENILLSWSSGKSYHNFVVTLTSNYGEEFSFSTLKKEIMVPVNHGKSYKWMVSQYGEDGKLQIESRWFDFKVSNREIGDLVLLSPEEVFKTSSREIKIPFKWKGESHKFQAETIVVEEDKKEEGSIGKEYIFDAKNNFSYTLESDKSYKWYLKGIAEDGHKVRSSIKSFKVNRETTHALGGSFIGSYTSSSQTSTNGQTVTFSGISYSALEIDLIWKSTIVDGLFKEQVTKVNYLRSFISNIEPSYITFENFNLFSISWNGLYRSDTPQNFFSRNFSFVSEFSLEQLVSYKLSGTNIESQKKLMIFLGENLRYNFSDIGKYHKTYLDFGAALAVNSLGDFKVNSKLSRIDEYFSKKIPVELSMDVFLKKHTNDSENLNILNVGATFALTFYKDL